MHVFYMCFACVYSVSLLWVVYHEAGPAAYIFVFSCCVGFCLSFWSFPRSDSPVQFDLHMCDECILAVSCTCFVCVSSV